MVTSITNDGIIFRANGRKFTLDMAPKDENGVVKLLELREDDMIWASGVLYFDPATGEYFPGQDSLSFEKDKIPEKEKENEDEKPVKRACEVSRKNSPKPVVTKRRRKGSRIIMDSVEEVGSGYVVNVF